MRMSFKIRDGGGELIAAVARIEDAYQLLYFGPDRKLIFRNRVAWNCKTKGKPITIDALQYALNLLKAKIWPEV